ncbi:caspase family protein [bacterium]|nr:caspase family protein [bacterium]
MEKKFNVLITSILIILFVFGLIGTALVSQAASVKRSRSLYRPIPATDVKIVKKTLHPVIGEAKDKPETPPGQDKEKKNGPEEKAATGILGEKVTGERYAIVIGICDYPGENYDICWADGDSLNMYEALTTLYGYDPDNIYLLRDTNPDHLDITDGAATFDNILSAVKDIKGKARSGDEVVFFFSGHGADGIAQDDDSESRDEAIVVHNGVDKLEYIWDGQLKGWFSDFDTSRIVFIFDSCLAGGMNDVAEAGRIVAMATSENQPAYVYSKGDEEKGEPGEGVFSHYFVNEGMLQAKGDKYDHDKDGIQPEGEDVVVEEAFDYAKEIIPSVWKRQKPKISDYFENDLLL